MGIVLIVCLVIVCRVLRICWFISDVGSTIFCFLRSARTFLGRIYRTVQSSVSVGIRITFRIRCNGPNQKGTVVGIPRIIFRLLSTASFFVVTVAIVFIIAMGSIGAASFTNVNEEGVSSHKMSERPKEFVCALRTKELQAWLYRQR